MTRPVPGYRSPADPGRSADQVMADGAAQNLIRQIIDLHEELHAKLDRDIELAAMGPTDPASGFVTGDKEHDRMDGRIAAISQAKGERARQLKNAREELRMVVRYYQERLGRRPPRRPPVQSIDYLDGAQRKVG